MPVQYGQKRGFIIKAKAERCTPRGEWRTRGGGIPQNYLKGGEKEHEIMRVGPMTFRLGCKFTMVFILLQKRKCAKQIGTKKKGEKKEV